MCISCVPGQPTEFYEERAPYVFAIDGSQAQKQDHVFEFISKQLIGQPATTPVRSYQPTERKFGLSTSRPARLDGAGQPAGGEHGGRRRAAGRGDPVPARPGDDPADRAAGDHPVEVGRRHDGDLHRRPGRPTRLHARGHGPGVLPRVDHRRRHARRHRRRSPAPTTRQQWQHAFGVTQLAARLSPRSAGYPTLYEWFNGEPPPADAEIGVDQPQAALFFSIVQNTGPEPDAQTWADALFDADPTARGAISQPSLSWGDKGLWDYPDYHGIDDATALWWDPTATGPDELRREGPGMWQYADQGLRYLPGEWGDGGPPVRPGTQRRPLHRAPARRGPRRLPQPRRRLTRPGSVAPAAAVQGKNRYRAAANAFAARATRRATLTRWRSSTWSSVLAACAIGCSAKNACTSAATGSSVSSFTESIMRTIVLLGNGALACCQCWRTKRPRGRPVAAVGDAAVAAGTARSAS